MKKETRKQSIRRFLLTHVSVRWAILLGIAAVFALLLYPNLLISPHHYEVGDVVESDIKAPRDFSVENREATTAVRKEASSKVLTVYDHDDTLIDQLKDRIDAAFSDLREALKTEVEADVPAEEGPPGTAGASSAGEKRPALGSDQKKALEEKLGISVSEEAFRILEKDGFSEKTARLITRIISEVLGNGVVANKDVLLTDSDKGIMLRSLASDTERPVQNLKKFHGPDQYKEVVRIVASPLVEDVSPKLVPVIVDFAQRLIQPNVTLNRSETEKRRASAASTVDPIPYQIKEGEMLLREGERVTPGKLATLRALTQETPRKTLYERSAGAMGLLLALLTVFWFLYVYQQDRGPVRNNKDLLFLAVLLTAFFFIPRISAVLFDALTQTSPLPIPAGSMVYGIPLAAGAMTVCLFMGMRIAIPFALIVSVCTAIVFQNRFQIFIFFLLSSLMGAYWMRECKERKVFIITGVKLGVLNALLATIASAYGGEFGTVRLLWDWGFGIVGGLGAGVITAGIIPLMEMSFGYTTDITLLELANLERPILRRLMLEAPGTYHHSVVVGSMVEAAASEIGANPVLAKVCGYYHDIGKIKKPLYFVENQTDGKNRHDKLAPSMSALILTSHVKDGVEMARRHHLGEPIIDTIRQHHGTSFIKYFYEKAKKLKGEENVKIDNFRYPGPRPQTREAGLVMLADVVEAASRTLENPTPSRIQGNVQKLINGVFTDGQLDNCELTLKDLHNIAKSFNKILNGIHHHRIEYPDADGKDKKEKKERNGRSDPQQPKPPKDPGGGKPSENGTGGLKRLGVS